MEGNDGFRGAMTPGPALFVIQKGAPHLKERLKRLFIPITRIEGIKNYFGETTNFQTRAPQRTPQSIKLPLL